MPENNILLATWQFWMYLISIFSFNILIPIQFKLLIFDSHKNRDINIIYKIIFSKLWAWNQSTSVIFPPFLVRISISLLL